jgi:hypothetical protein
MFETFAVIGVLAIVGAAWVSSKPKSRRSGKQFSNNNYRAGIKSPGYYENKPDKYRKDVADAIKERYSEEHPYDLYD